MYRIAPSGGELHRLDVDLEQPNGLCFSLDEKLLYVNDSPGRRIFVYEVLADGSVSAPLDSGHAPSFIPFAQAPLPTAAPSATSSVTSTNTPNITTLRYGAI